MGICKIQSKAIFSDNSIMEIQSHLKISLLILSVSLTSYGKGFSGYASAMETSQNLFLSAPAIEQVVQHKSQLDRFIKSPVFQGLSNIEKRKIRYIQRHTDKYLDISKYLAECEQRLEQPDQRSLISQIQAGLSSVSPCDELAEGLLSEYQVENINVLVDEVSKASFRNRMHLESLKNTGRAILKYQYQFGLASQLSNAELTRLAEKLCGRQCNEKRKQGLVQYLKKTDSQVRTALQQGLLTQYSAKSAVNQINERNQSLEQALENIALEKKKRDPSQEKIQELYDVYSQKYVALASDTLGSLLLTDTMKKETGTLINLEDIKTVSQRRGAVRGITRPRHRTVVDTYKCRRGRSGFRTVRDEPGRNLQNCTKEKSVEEKLVQAVEEAIKRAHTFNRDMQEENDIQEMIKKNPIAAGQSLIKHPNMVQYVCDEVINIVQTDARNEKLFNYAETALNALDTASIGLLATGVGAVAGGAVKGVSTAARAGSLLLKASVLGGMGASAIRAVAGGAGVLAFNEQRQEIINSRIAEARTSEDIARIRDIEERLGKSRSHLIDAGLDVLPFGVLNKLRKTGGLAKLSGKSPTLNNQLQAEENVIQLNDYLTAPANKDVINKLSALSTEFGKDKLETLLAGVSQMSPAIRTQILNKLSKTDISDSSVRELISELEGAVNQCVA